MSVDSGAVALLYNLTKTVVDATLLTEIPYNEHTAFLISVKFVDAAEFIFTVVDDAASSEP